jgi:hypothetical protein
MTKKLFLFTTACLLSTAAMQAGKALKVHSTGSAEPQKIELANIRKITYVDNEMLITTHGETPNYTFVLVELDKLTFGGNLTNIDTPMANNQNVSVYISSQGEVMIRSEAQILSLTVYSVTGAIMLTSTSENLNVSALPTGVYLLGVETTQGTAIKKFIKR